MNDAIISITTSKPLNPCGNSADSISLRFDIWAVQMFTFFNVFIWCRLSYSVALLRAQCRTNIDVYEYIRWCCGLWIMLPEYVIFNCAWISMNIYWLSERNIETVRPIIINIYWTWPSPLKLNMCTENMKHITIFILVSSGLYRHPI